MAEARTGSIPASPDENHQFPLVLDLIQQINQGADPEHVFGLVADALREIFRIDRFALVLLQPDGTLSLTATRGLSSRYLAVVRERVDEGPGARALARRRPMYIPDATTSPDYWPFQDAAREEGLRTLLILPLLSGSDPLGYLIMYHDRIRHYTPAEIMLAHALAQQAGLAVQHARLLAASERHSTDLEHRFQQRVAEAEAIDDIVLQIASSLDLDRTLESITTAAATLSGASTAALYFRDTAENFRAVASSGIALERLQKVVLTPSDGLIAQMCRTGAPAQVTNFAEEVLTTEAAREAVTQTGTQATLGVPLMQQGVCVGALYVARQQAIPFSPDTIRLLSRLTAFAHVAVQNARRFTAVEEERSQLQAYLDAIPEGVIIFDRQGKVMLVNNALEREMGFLRPVIDVDHREMFSNPERFWSRKVSFRYDNEAVFRRVLATGKPEQGLVEMENPNRTYEVHFNSLRISSDRVEGVVATMRDITEPLDLERERSRANLLVQLLDLSVLLNSNLSVPALTERVVEAAMQLIGARAGALGLIEGERLVFRRFHTPGGWIDFNVALHPGEGAPGYVWQTMEPYVSNDCASDPRVLLDVQQQLDFHRLAYVPVIDREGRIIGTLGVYDPTVERDLGRRDVEALQLLAHQVSIAIENARLSEMKDAFLSIVSHELKTPVTSIKGFTQILQRRLSPEAQQVNGRYLEVINQQADRLTALINDLLDLSRIQTGRFAFETGAVDYTQLVRDVVSEMKLITRDHRIELTVTDSLAVQGNANRLRQVLVNLIDNAATHGPAGGPIHVSVERHNGTIITAVSDEGPGLPPGEEERIFNPYYQVRDEKRHHTIGLGLGLYISRQIVNEHGGRIWVDPAARTCFRFSLPDGEPD